MTAGRYANGSKALIDPLHEHHGGGMKIMAHWRLILLIAVLLALIPWEIVLNPGTR